MGLFGRNKDKPSDEAGRWAAIAMGCVVFADGVAEQSEVDAAQAVVNTMPVVKNSIGPEEAERLFLETVEAVRPLPETMLDAYVTKLDGMAKNVKSVDDKNFALAAVIAVSKGDGVLTQGEHQLIARFKESLGATIRLPDPGQSVPLPYRPAAAVQPAEIGCPTCNQPTQLYEGYGNWCDTCQQYASATPQVETASPAEVDEPAPEPSVAGGVTCAGCSSPTQYYEGYGNWCSACQQYTE